MHARVHVASSWDVIQRRHSQRGQRTRAGPACGVCLPVVRIPWSGATEDSGNDKLSAMMERLRLRLRVVGLAQGCRTLQSFCGGGYLMVGLAKACCGTNDRSDGFDLLPWSSLYGAEAED